MTFVIVFKRGCIFMCNSFVETMFANDGASDLFHHFITLGKFTHLLLIWTYNENLGALAYVQVFLILQTLPSLDCSILYV